MTEKKTPNCRECHILFKTWNEVAKHIIGNQDTHTRQSVVFAYHVLSEVDNVREHKQAAPISDELKKTIKECVRDISGEMKKCLVKCPQCRQLHSKEIEIEHLVDWAWRDDDGKLMILCGDCRRK